MINSNTKDMKSKITVGNMTVWGILLVSLAATLAYWYVLAGLETAKGLSSMWMALLWVSVAVGLVAEVIKKVTLSTFRNKRIWMAATLVSILTVLGTYSILNQTRQNDLTKQSDSYQDSRANKKAADFLASQYAYAAGYDLTALEAQLDQVIVDRDNRKIKYNTYLKRKQALEKKIEAKRNYDSAISTSNQATANMAGSGSVSSSSNPLLASISSVFNISENLLTMLFYLFVTILLEVAAFWIGGEVEKLKQHMKLTEAELLDMKNQELFGFSVRDVQRDLFDRVKRSQKDAMDAEYEVQKIRKTRKYDDANKQLSAGEVAAIVNQKRVEADTNQQAAKAEPVKAEVSPAPENEPVEQGQSVGFKLPKNAESTAEKNRRKRADNQTSLKHESTSLNQSQTSEKMNDGSKLVKGINNQYVTTSLNQRKKTPTTLAQSGSSKLVKNQGENGAKNQASLKHESTSLSQSQTSDKKGGVISDTGLIYSAWKKAVLSGECRLTDVSSREWVKGHLGVHTSRQVKKVTDSYASQIADLLRMRGHSEKMLKLNPDYKAGNRKTKYLLA